MHLKVRNLFAQLCILFLLFPYTMFGKTLGQAKGRLEGYVVNLQNGDLLIKAKVEVVGKGIIVETGVDGDYSLSLEPGTYTIKFFRDGFRNHLEENVAIAAGETREVKAVLTPVDYKGEVVDIKASNGDDVVGTIEERKAASTISDTISRIEISKDTASSAAGVLQRSPGITLVNDFVYVRGLGDRYSNTMLNNSVLTSTEPDRKVVPMDLIPSSLLQNVKVLKTFTPDQPGEFSGGLVKLDTIELPKATTLSLSFSLGFNSQTQGEDFLRAPSSGSDFKEFFGFGRNNRALPASIPSNERLLRELPPFFPGLSPAELQAIGRSFENIWDPRAESARPDLGWGLSGGTAFGKFGIVGALNFKNELRTLDEIRNFYQISGQSNGQPIITPSSAYDYDRSTTTARLGSALNLAYQFNNQQKVFFKNFFTNQASDEARIFEGFNQDRGTTFLNHRLRYVQEKIYTGQLSGDHVLTLLWDTILTWRYTYSRATLDEPDLRESLYEQSQFTGDFIYLNQTQSLFRLFNEMRENLREPAFDVVKFWFFGNKSLNLKAGASCINRDRVFDSRRFRFVPRDLQGIDTSLRPEQLLVPSHISPEIGFEIREETRTTDHYDALHNISAGYVMGDLAMGNWRFIGGVRVEKSLQRVTTFEPFQVNPSTVQAELDDTDYLPSIGLAYSFRNSSMAIRSGYSRTLARPQFRELSPFEFTDVTGGRSTQGNANLKRTLINNYDVRYEWFLAPSELLAVSFFHKDLDDPIEAVVRAQTTLITSFNNAETARNSGLEVEFRKNLNTLWNRFDHLALNLNYTYVRSRVEIGADNAERLTNAERPLVGQAENVFNLVLNYDIPRWQAEARALFNYTGERISDVGALGLPDIIEHGYPSLDALFSKSFGGETKWRFEFQAENLLNRRVDFRLDDQAFNVYKRGRTFSFGVSYKVF